MASAATRLIATAQPSLARRSVAVSFRSWNSRTVRKCTSCTNSTLEWRRLQEAGARVRVGSNESVLTTPSLLDVMVAPRRSLLLPLKRRPSAWGVPAMKTDTPKYGLGTRISRGYATTSSPGPTLRLRPKLTLRVALLTFAIALYAGVIAVVMGPRRNASALAYLVLVQQVDRSYHEHDFDSIESTKEYYFELCRALPDNYLKWGEDMKEFIEAVEMIIRIAAEFPLTGGGHPTSPSLPSPAPLPSPSPSSSSYPDIPSHPLLAIHSIMRTHAVNVHDLLSQDLHTVQSLVACAKEVLDGFRLANNEIAAVCERMAEVKRRDAFVSTMGALEGSGRGPSGSGRGGEERKGAGEYDSTG